jgi:hypothetical protein
MTDDEESREWIDRLAIADLIYRYSDGVTRGDWDQVEAVFAPDAIWESPVLGMRYESARSFREFMESTTFELLIQTPHAPVIRLLGPHQAQTTTTIHELGRGVQPFDNAFGEAGTPLNFEQYGVYHDDLAELDGRWRFTHRLFAPLHFRADCVTGEVPTARSTLVRPVSV